MTDERSTTLHHLHQWPTRAWCKRYTIAPSVVLLSESALLHAFEHPAAVAEISVPVYVLTAELERLRPHYAILRDDAPAGIIQVNATQWVELTLNCRPVVVWNANTVAEPTRETS